MQIAPNKNSQEQKEPYSNELACLSVKLVYLAGADRYKDSSNVRPAAGLPRPFRVESSARARRTR